MARLSIRERVDDRSGMEDLRCSRIEGIGNLLSQACSSGAVYHVKPQFKMLAEDVYDIFRFGDESESAYFRIGSDPKTFVDIFFAMERSPGFRLGFAKLRPLLPRNRFRSLDVVAQSGNHPALERVVQGLKNTGMDRTELVNPLQIRGYWHTTLPST